MLVIHDLRRALQFKSKSLSRLFYLHTIVSSKWEFGFREEQIAQGLVILVECQRESASSDFSHCMPATTFCQATFQNRVCNSNESKYSLQSFDKLGKGSGKSSKRSLGLFSTYQLTLHSSWGKRLFI